MTSAVIGSALMPATLPVTPEQEFPIRLIALDIDGTIIGDDHEIAERTTAAVRRAMERDVAVSLVTGRMVSSAMRFAHDLGLTVTCWTFRADEKTSFASVKDEMSNFLYTLGIDALFTNNPDQFPRR